MFTPHISKPANPAQSTQAAQARPLIPRATDNRPHFPLTSPGIEETFALHDGASSKRERMSRKRLYSVMAAPSSPVNGKENIVIDTSFSLSHEAAESMVGEESQIIEPSLAELAIQHRCARQIQRAFHRYRERNANTLKLKAYLHAVMEKVNTAVTYSASAIERNREPSDLVPFDYRIQLTNNGARLVPASEVEKNQARFCMLNTFNFREFAENHVERKDGMSRPLEKYVFLARHGYGNCTELAEYVKGIILRDLASNHPIATEPGSNMLKDIAVCALLDGDHVFAVVGALNNNNALVVDPWAKYINTIARGRHTDLPVRHADKTRGFLGRMGEFRNFLFSNPAIFGLKKESDDKELVIGTIVPMDAEKVQPAQYADIAQAIEARIRSGDKTLLHQKEKQALKDYIHTTVYRAN